MERVVKGQLWDEAGQWDEEAGGGGVGGVIVSIAEIEANCDRKKWYTVSDEQKFEIV